MLEFEIKRSSELDFEMKKLSVVKGDPGESAYQVALKNGFVGTAEEWLASLKGENGDDYVLTDADKVEIAEAAAQLVEVNAIPTPTTAEVGQIIVVSEVDEDGKPTEWEAVGLSLGFGEDGKLYIFVSGVPVGDGIEIDGTITPSDGVLVFAADFSGSAPSSEQFYSWEGRDYAGAITDALANIQCTDGVAKLTSVYDADKGKWIQQMMTTGGLFESDNFICTFRAKFSGLAGSWQNIITYGTGTHWTDGMYSKGIKWPSGGEIDAFEQAGGYADTPNTFQLVAHYGSGTGSGYPDTHVAQKAGVKVDFTTDEWHDFKFSLNNGYVRIWIDGVLVSESNFSACSVSNNYLVDYLPFLKPHAFYIDGSCAAGSANTPTENVYEFEVSDFRVYQDENVTCTALEIYPQMWEKGTELVFPTGAELYLDRIYTPTNVSNKACTWQSSNTDVATVVQGYVKTIAEGNAVITATCGGVSASYNLTVSNSEANIPCAKLVAKQEVIGLSVGDNFDLAASLYKYPSFTTDSVSFVSDSEAFTVSADGTVTAVSEGSGEVQVVCGNQSINISFSAIASNEPLIDSTFDVSTASAQQSDTLTGGVVSGETYTAIWVLSTNPRYTSGSRALSISMYNNKSPGIQVSADGSVVTGRVKAQYALELGAPYDGMEIRCVFTVGGEGQFYVDGVAVEGASGTTGYLPIGTDTYVSTTALSDLPYALSRFALYKGEYLDELPEVTA